MRRQMGPRNVPYRLAIIVAEIFECVGHPAMLTARGKSGGSQKEACRSSSEGQAQIWELKLARKAFRVAAGALPPEGPSSSGKYAQVSMLQ